METRAGTGYSDDTDSYAAGRAAAEAALARSGLESCDLAILFATSRHDPAELRDGVRSVIGERGRLIGGSAGGVITNDSLGYDGFQVGVAVLGGDDLRIDLFAAEPLCDGEFETGADLGGQISGTSFDTPPNLILLYDSARTPATDGPPVLNMATPLIDGLTSTLHPMPPTAGAGLLGDGMFQLPIAEWLDHEILRQSAMALALSGNVRMDTLILHGCRPASDYHTITRAEGSTIHEIDDRPALDVIEDLLGSDSAVAISDFPLFVTLGMNRGEKFAEFREENYVNRLCFAVDPVQRSLIMFEPDLTAGEQVQLMRRSVGFEYIAERVGTFLDGLSDRRPLFALYIDCLGRAAAYSSTEQEEAEEVQRQVGDRIPLLGFYSGVEIATVAGRLQALDWTGVLCLFTADE